MRHTSRWFVSLLSITVAGSVWAAAPKAATPAKAAAAPPAATTTRYTLDAAHSTVGFTIPHLVISTVHGRFDKFESSFAFDEKAGLLSDLVAKIDLDSVNTNEPKRDAHLKTPDFFGARGEDGKTVNEAKRWMTFKETKSEKVAAGKKTKVTGDLTLNGVTKPVVLDVTYKGTAKDPWGNQKLGFEASGKLKRKDYGLAWNKALETGGVLVGEDVTIVIDGEAGAVKDEAPAKK